MGKEATEGIGVGGQNSIGGSVGVWARNQSPRGKHRTEVTEATEGDLGYWPKFYRWQRERLGEKSDATEKHRTEVTEATEGDLGLVAKFYWWQLRRLGEKSGATESIAQRGRRPQRGIGLVAKILSVAAWAFGREIKSKGKASHRGRGGRLCFMVKDSISCSGVRSMPKCKPPPRKERKTWGLIHLGTTMSPNECLDSLGANPRPGRDGVTERILATYRKIPLCDLCAMLSLGS
jgi:hypothetical protein